MADETGKIPSNSDLIWDLDGISQRELAVEFVMKFKKVLCIYSSAVEKLYTNYDLIFPPSENHSMVVIPNQEAYHDTFNNLNKEAIVDTPFDIILGAMIGKRGLYLRMPTPDKTSTQAIPFRLAAEHIVLNSSGKRPLIPILVKGNLREFEFKNPYLHLNSINLDKLTKLSAFETKDIHRTVWDKFKLLASRLPPTLPEEANCDLSGLFGPDG